MFSFFARILETVQSIKTKKLKAEIKKEENKENINNLLNKEQEGKKQEDLGNQTVKKKAKLVIEKGKLLIFKLIRIVIDIFEKLLLWIVATVGIVATFVILAAVAVIIIMMLYLASLKDDGLLDDVPNAELPDIGQVGVGGIVNIQWTEEELAQYGTYFNGYEKNLFRIAILTKNSVEGWGTANKYNTVLGHDVTYSMFRMSMGVQTTETGWGMYSDSNDANTKDVFIHPSTKDLEGDIQGPYQMGSSWLLSNREVVPSDIESIIKNKYINPNGGGDRHYYPYATTISVLGTYYKMKEQGLSTDKYTEIFKKLAPKFNITTDFEKFQSEAIVMLMQTAYLSAPESDEREGICAFIAGVWAMSSDDPAKRSFDNYELDFSKGLELSTSNHQQFFGVLAETESFSLITPYLSGDLKNLEFGSSKTIKLNGNFLNKPLVAEVVTKYWDIPEIQAYNTDVLNYSADENQFVLKGIYGIESFLVGKQILGHLSSKLPVKASEVAGGSFSTAKIGVVQGNWPTEIKSKLEASVNKQYYGTTDSLANPNKMLERGITLEQWRQGSKWKIPFYRQYASVVESGYTKIKASVPYDEKGNYVVLQVNGCHVFMNSYLLSAMTGRLINPAETWDAMLQYGSIGSDGLFLRINFAKPYEALGLKAATGYIYNGEMTGLTVSGEAEYFKTLLGGLNVNSDYKSSSEEWKRAVDTLLDKNGIVGIACGERLTSQNTRFAPVDTDRHYIVITEKVGGDAYKVMTYGASSHKSVDYLTYTWDDIYLASCEGDSNGQIFFVHNPNY